MLTAKENLWRVLHGQEPERIPVECLPNPRYGDGAYTFIAHRGALVPSEGGYDLWGVRWAHTAEMLPYPVEHPAGTPQEALALPFPDVHDLSLWEAVCAEAVAMGRDTIVIARQVFALYERYASLIGVQAALLSLAGEPEVASAVLEHIAGWQAAAADHFIAAGVQAGRISDDYGTQTSLLFSLATWRRLIRPPLERIVQRYQQAGLPVILHSCGNLAPIMDDLVELGFAAFNIQANANDLPAFRRRYGRRLCIWGGVSTQALVAATPGEVRGLVRQAVESLGVGGGLILEPDQLVSIPEENLRAYREAARELRGPR